MRNEEEAPPPAVRWKRGHRRHVAWSRVSVGSGVASELADTNQSADENADRVDGRNEFAAVRLIS